jgi:hypothetical protein
MLYSTSIQTQASAEDSKVWRYRFFRDCGASQKNFSSAARVPCCRAPDLIIDVHSWYRRSSTGSPALIFSTLSLGPEVLG